ncbi:hypothetical protein EDD17DRAFT_1668697 [Pisolithus thermaeus]|nr:hypothetical protein EDD17DRAFT_1668697 [Pisolithus thermaeus]
MDSKWLDEGMDTPKAPDKGSQSTSNEVAESGNLPKLSFEALEPQGDLPDTTSKCAETQTGHRKPKTEVVDTQQVVNVLPMVEVGTTEEWNLTSWWLRLGLWTRNSRMNAQTYSKHLTRSTYLSQDLRYWSLQMTSRQLPTYLIHLALTPNFLHCKSNVLYYRTRHEHKVLQIQKSTYCVPGEATSCER